MELQFEVVVLTEYPLEPANHLFGLFHVAAHDSLGHLASQTGRATDQTLVILFEQLFVDTGFVVEAFGKGVGDDLAEVVISGQVLCQQDQVVTGLLVLVLLETVAHHIDFAPQNRLDTGRDCRIVKVLHTVHISVVRDGQRCHTQLLGPFYQRPDRRSAIQNRVLCMYVQVYEIRHCLLSFQVTKQSGLSLRRLQR